MMKLCVTIKETPVGRHLVLCEENGDILPCQTKLTITDSASDNPRLIVEFMVDGKDLELVSEQVK